MAKALPIIGLVFFAALALAAPVPNYGQTIVELAISTPDLSTLVTALKASRTDASDDLFEDLSNRGSNYGPFTVFAPSNEAFAKLPKATLASLLDPKNVKELDDVLNYHVIAPGYEVQTGDLNQGSQEFQTLTRLPGIQDLRITKSGSSVTVQKAHVITADVVASNGVVHIIDGVLSPQVFNIVELAVSNPDLSTLVAALKAGNLTAALSGAGPFTVFAPTNEAFAKLPKATLASLLDPKNIKELEDILKYHVIAGAAVNVKPLYLASQYYKTLEGTRLNIEVTGPNTVKVHGRDWTDYRGSSEANIIAKDVRASNGLVQIIDGVLMPPRKNIVGLASGNAGLSTLVTALKAGNLVTALSGCTPSVIPSLSCDGTSTVPLTVFAPTNEAFAKLPKATLASLLEPKNIKELDDILKYHVIVGAAVYVKDLKASQNVTTLEGQQLRITKSGSSVTVQKALVITADVSASNGVVHIIDGVLSPPGAKPVKKNIVSVLSVVN